MKNLSIKTIRNILVFLLVAQSINLVTFKAVEISSQKLGTYLYQEFTQPFLANGLVARK